MISSRPYLLRAMHEWMSDCGQTPQIVVDATVDGVLVPQDFVRDGKIVLNISRQAAQGLAISNDRLECEARFGGRPFRITVPVPAILGIYARESGQGMLFGGETEPPPAGGSSDGPARTKLRVVK